VELKRMDAAPEGAGGDLRARRRFQKAREACQAGADGFA